MAVDSRVCRFRDYWVGAKNASVATDHKSLRTIFKIKTPQLNQNYCTKLHNQDVPGRNY